MEEKKRLDPAYLESLAEDEYEGLKGRLVRVRAINGYVGEATSDTFNIDIAKEPPVIVRIGEAQMDADIHRWMDEWLDPAYPVEIVERGDLPIDLRSCWIYGNCRSLDGGFEPGDVWAMTRTRGQIRLDIKEQLERMREDEALDIENIAARLGGKVCDPPPNRRHLMAFMADRDKGALYEHAMDVSDRLTGRKIPEAVEVYDQMAERRLDAKAAAPSVLERLEKLEAKVAELSARRCGPPPRFK